MFEIAAGQTSGLSDLESFVAMVNQAADSSQSASPILLDSDRDVFIARAPGRLDVMGGIADYSGSLVLQWPISQATTVAVQRQDEPSVNIVSCPPADDEPVRVADIPLSQLCPDGQPVTYQQAFRLFNEDAKLDWAAYVAGPLLVLLREKHVSLQHGLRVLIRSEVPEGKGVSSSAAIEVATMQALQPCLKLDLSPQEVAILCQKGENLVVGAPCGVMDQMTASCGQSGELLQLRCQPAELLPPIAVPAGVRFWGLDSGLRHSVAGSDYTSVRVGAFMGYRIIADLAGLRVHAADDGSKTVQVEDSQWGGYLANITPELFDKRFRSQLPERMSGSDFLERYGNTTDPVTAVVPDHEYAVRQPTTHPVYENARVQRFADLLQQANSPETLDLLGELMFHSHASYSACGLGSEGTDQLVSLVRDEGAEAGLYGAKITGGGSGGTVAVLGDENSDSAIQRVVQRYHQQTGHDPFVFSGSSPGAGATGHIRLRPA